MWHMCVCCYYIHMLLYLSAQRFQEINNCWEGLWIQETAQLTIQNWLLVHGRCSVLRVTVINWNEKHMSLRVCVQEIQTLLPFGAIKLLTPPSTSPSVCVLPAVGTLQLAKGLIGRVYSRSIISVNHKPLTGLNFDLIKEK